MNIFLPSGGSPPSDPLPAYPAPTSPLTSCLSPSGPAPGARGPAPALRQSPASHSPEAPPRARWLGAVSKRGLGIGGERGRGGGGPPLWPGRPSAGVVGVTEAVTTRPEPGPGPSAAAAPSPSATSPEEGRVPPINPPHHSRLPSPEQLPVPLPGDRLRGRTPSAPEPGRLLGKEGRRARGE